MTVLNPPSFLQAITDATEGYSAASDRLVIGSAYGPAAAALSARSGILPAASGGRGEVTVISNTVVRVNAFRAVLQGTRAGAQGQYNVINDAAVDRTIGAQAAGVLRSDLVCILVRDTAYAPDTQDNADVVVVPGTPAASAPQVPAMNGVNLGNYLALGVLNVPATGGTVTFTPYPALFTTAVGGIRPTDAADALAGVFDGQYRDNPARGGLERWSAVRGAWDPQGEMVCTSATRPANPVVGTKIFETDTGSHLWVDSYGWQSARNGWTPGLMPGWAGGGVRCELAYNVCAITMDVWWPGANFNVAAWTPVYIVGAWNMSQPYDSAMATSLASTNVNNEAGWEVSITQQGELAMVARWGARTWVQNGWAKCSWAYCIKRSGT